MYTSTVDLVCCLLAQTAPQQSNVVVLCLQYYITVHHQHYPVQRLLFQIFACVPISYRPVPNVNYTQGILCSSDASYRLVDIVPCFLTCHYIDRTLYAFDYHATKRAGEEFRRLLVIWQDYAAGVLSTGEILLFFRSYC